MKTKLLRKIRRKYTITFNKETRYYILWQGIEKINLDQIFIRLLESVSLYGVDIPKLLAKRKKRIIYKDLTKKSIKL